MANITRSAWTAAMPITFGPVADILDDHGIPYAPGRFARQLNVRRTGRSRRSRLPRVALDASHMWLVLHSPHKPDARVLTMPLLPQEY